jgi:hypothetical protein
MHGYFGRMSGVDERCERPSTPNHSPVKRGDAAMAEKHFTLIACACGCGAIRLNRNSQGQLRRFMNGHKPLPPQGKVGYTVRNKKRVHVSIAERALGKSLPKGAEVHHVDGNRWNNANSNLVICQDHGYHYLLHARARIVRAGGNPNTQRICCHCQRPLALELFVRAGNQCRQCIGDRARRYRELHHDHVLAREAASRARRRAIR